MNFSYGRMYDNIRPRMGLGQQPMRPQQPMGQMSTPLQASQTQIGAVPANYGAIAQQMQPQMPQGPRMGYGMGQPQRGMAA